ncbi:hypothetical protein ACFLS1_05565 [Verrucomicrobiota bacterium]
MYILIPAILLIVLWLGLRESRIQDSAKQKPTVAEEINKKSPGLTKTVSKQTAAPAPDLLAADTQSELSGEQTISPSPVLTETQDKPAEENLDLDNLEEPEDQQDEAHLGVASCQTKVPKGGALLTGGWPMPDGSHMFVLVTPRLDPDKNTNSVELAGRFFSISPDKLTDPGWEKLLTGNEDGMHINGETYDSSQLKQFRKNYKPELKNILSAPSVTVEYGSPGSISLVGSTSGIMLSVLATKDPEGGVELAVSVAEYAGVRTAEDE